MDRARTEKSMKCQEIFEKINEHQVEAVDFHCQMVSLFDFLGLEGFEKMHEYRFIDESLEHMKTKREFMDRHQRLLKDGSRKGMKYIDEEWFSASRCDVPTQVREKSVEEAMNQYEKWEEETKDYYEDCATKAMEAGCHSEYRIIEELIKDVDEELKHIHKLVNELKGVGYDSEYIYKMQEPLEEKYERKIEHLKEKVSKWHKDKDREYKTKDKHESKYYDGEREEKSHFKIGMNPGKY